LQVVFSKKFPLLRNPQFFGIFHNLGTIFASTAVSNNSQTRFIMKTRLIPAIAIALMGIFATSSFAQEEATTEPQATETEVVADNASEKIAKEDPRADRAKERFERKDAKKSEIAAHKAEKQALKEERAAARAERKEAKDAEKEARKAEREALKEERALARAERKEAKKAEWENRKAEKEAQKAEKAAMKEERKANKEHGHNK
jgi:hypothetical protein